ncbi:FMN-binding protein [Cellulomonas sp. KRMCY2]|uniref:FMN-binding protein n=1 Tax=Cellulomonas sp. KRMCY2 TaxID=1304865 RepID=UPI00045EBB55|nr:FMN-binding protein [Cellulomonas sp. KRMCY2]
MRRIAIAIGTTLTGLVLLFSWPTSLNRAVVGSGTTPATGTTTTGSGTSTTGSGTATADAGSGAETTAAATPVVATYDGAAASTRYGDVQVRITVTDGVLTSAEAIAYPSGDRHNEQINAYAIPILNDEATSAGSAQISMVSGATVTSRGYVQSLQDALDQAGL